MESGEALIVMNADSTLDDDDGFASCVRTSIANAETGIRLMAEKEFRNSLFPWFEQMINEQAIASLVSKPLVRNRIAELRVRYIIAVTGSTKSEWGKGWGSNGAYIGESGVMMCGTGAGGAGCLGLTAWKRMSDLSAVIWDLRTGTAVGSIAAQVSGTNVMPAFVLPVPLIMPTETSACNELGASLTRFLTTGELPKEPEIEGEKEKPLTDPNK